MILRKWLILMKNLNLSILRCRFSILGHKKHFSCLRKNELKKLKDFAELNACLSNVYVIKFPPWKLFGYFKMIAAKTIIFFLCYVWFLYFMWFIFIYKLYNVAPFYIGYKNFDTSNMFSFKIFFWRRWILKG